MITPFRNLVWLVLAITLFVGMILGLHETEFTDIGRDFGLFGNLMAGLWIAIIAALRWQGATMVQWFFYATAASDLPLCQLRLSAGADAL